MVAYLDLIILENFFMNYIMLYTTGKLLNRKIKTLRIIIASAIGVVYVFSLCFNVPQAILNISKIAVAMVLVKICYGSSKLKSVLKESLIFLVISCIYAGCALAFVHLAKPKVLYMVNGIIIGGEYIFELVLLSALVGFLLIKVSMKMIKFKQWLNKKDMLGNLEIINNHKSVKMHALLDTGNLLRDPISGKPVIVVNKSSIKELFPESLLSKIDSMMGGDEIKNDDNFDARLKVIPYKSVGNNNGIMVAYKVDKIKVEYNLETYEIDDVLVGFYNGTLNKDDKYSALIGLQILERSNTKLEHNTGIKGKGKYSVC